MHVTQTECSPQLASLLVGVHHGYIVFPIQSLEQDINPHFEMAPLHYIYNRIFNAFVSRAFED